MEYSLPRELSNCSHCRDYPNYMEPEFFQFCGFLRRCSWESSSAATRRCVTRKSDPEVFVKLLCFETPGTKYSVTKHHIPGERNFQPESSLQISQTIILFPILCSINPVHSFYQTPLFSVWILYYHLRQGILRCLCVFRYPKLYQPSLQHGRFISPYKLQKIRRLTKNRWY
jgi:hypothetical protein